jgi:hypothetical protein
MIKLVTAVVAAIAGILWFITAEEADDLTLASMFGLICIGLGVLLNA